MSPSVISTPAYADLAQQLAAEIEVRLAALEDGGEPVIHRWAGLDDVFDEAFRAVALVVLDEQLRGLDPLTLAKASGQGLRRNTLSEPVAATSSNSPDANAGK